MKFVDQPPKDLSRHCVTHGSYTAKCEKFGSKFMLIDHCPACSADERKAKEQIENEQRREQEQNRLLARKHAAGLRQRHLDCRFDNYETNLPQQQAALDKVQNFVNMVLGGGNGNLILSGMVGTGKTHLASALVSVCIEAGKTAHIIKLPELMRLIKSSWSDSEQSEQDIIQRLSGVDVLVIDEVGVQYGSDTEKLVMGEIIDNRYQELRPTVLVSNLDVAGIKSCLGDRCFDRLRQDDGTLVGFEWESFRVRK